MTRGERARERRLALDADSTRRELLRGETALGLATPALAIGF